MNKSQLTINELIQALSRIINKKTIRISPERKLSVKAVEDEANLGDGTAYYYKEIITKIKNCIAENNKPHKINNEAIVNNSLRLKLKNEKKLKKKYREEIKDLKLKLSLLASQNNEFAISIQQYKQRLLEIESNVSFIKK